MIFTYKNLQINFLQGEILEEVPKNSICIDGIYPGPLIDPFMNRYSFDHHLGNIPRHVINSSSKQIYDARVIGWSPPLMHNKIWVYINDIDLDSMMSLFILTLPREAVLQLKEWVEVINGSDVFGPVYEPSKRYVSIRTFLYYKILRKQRGASAQQHIISILNAFQRYFNKKNNYNIKQKTSKLVILDKSNFILPDTNKDLFMLTIYSEDPIFEYAYREGADIAIGVRRRGDRYKYSIAKKSDFIPYNLSELIRLTSLIENGWGGGTSIVGSPENGSKIPLQDLLFIIKKGEIPKKDEKSKNHNFVYNEK